MSQMRSSKFQHNDGFITKERMILVQRIEFLESENQQLKNREISLKKINSLLIDALNSNPKIEERIINQLRFINNLDKNSQFRICQEEIIRLRDELEKRKGSFDKTYLEVFKPQTIQETSQKRSINNSRIKLQQLTIKESSELDKYSLRIPSPPSIASSNNYMKPLHKRRLSERVYQIQIKQKQDQQSKLEVKRLIRQKQMIQKQIQNCQRNYNENIDSQIESIVCIVKNRKKSKQNHSFRQIKEQPLIRNFKDKFGLDIGNKIQRFITPRTSKLRR